MHGPGFAAAERSSLAEWSGRAREKNSESAAQTGSSRDIGRARQRHRSTLHRHLGETSMASCKSSLNKRSRRPLGSSHRKRWSLLPRMETLENRLVLSGRTPLAPHDMAGIAMSGAASMMALDDGLVAVPLASGGTAWLQTTAASGPLLAASPGRSGGSDFSVRQPIPSIPGAMRRRRRRRPGFRRRHLRPIRDDHAEQCPGQQQ